MHGIRNLRNWHRVDRVGNLAERDRHPPALMVPHVKAVHWFVLGHVDWVMRARVESQRLQ